MKSKFDRFDKFKNNTFNKDNSDYDIDTGDFCLQGSNVSNNRYVVNRGKSKKYDFIPYAGIGVSFNGIDQYIKIPSGNLPLSILPTDDWFYCLHINNAYSTVRGKLFMPSFCNVAVERYNGDLIITLDDAILGKINKTIVSGTDAKGSIVVSKSGTTISIFYKMTLIHTYTINTLSGGIGAMYIGGVNDWSQYANCIIQNVIVSKGSLSYYQAKFYNSQPENFLYIDSNGVMKSDCGLNISNLQAWLPLCENGLFVKNMITYSEGTERGSVTNTMFGVDNNGNTSSLNTSTGVCTVRQIAASSATYTPQLIVQNSNKLSGEIYIFKIKYNIIEGYVSSSGIQLCDTEPNYSTLNQVNYNSYSDNNGNRHLYPGEHEITIIGNYMLIGNDNRISLNSNGTVGFPNNYTMTYSIKKVINGLHNIVNYTDACRSNAIQLPYGLQFIKINRDNAGFYSTMIKNKLIMSANGCNLGTKWFPQKPITSKETIEILITRPITPQRFWYKYTTLGEDSGIFTLETSPNNSYGVSFRYRGITGSNGNWINNKQYWTFTSNGVTAKVYVNGVEVYSALATVAFTNQYVVGVRLGTSSEMLNDSVSNVNILLFRANRKHTTPTEVVKKYNYLVRKGVMS